jgi:hypothetical protein
VPAVVFLAGVAICGFAPRVPSRTILPQAHQENNESGGFIPLDPRLTVAASTWFMDDALPRSESN